MDNIKVISFDAEGTLVTPRFSYVIWYEAIPMLFSQSRSIDLETARLIVTDEYHKIGDQRPEWYDLKYWCRYFGLDDYRTILNDHQHDIAFYPEVDGVLAAIKARYPRVVISSASAREFLDLFIERMGNHFTKVFSSISDFGKMKSADFYETVCRELDIDASQMLHIGDNWQFDHLVPSQLGIKTCFLDRSGNRKGPGVVNDLSQFLGQI